MNNCWGKCMYNISVKIHNELFRISTNSLYIYKILSAELKNIEESQADHQLQIEIIYLRPSELYIRYLNSSQISVFNQPIFLFDKKQSTMIISSLEDIYSIRSFITREILDYFYTNLQCIALHSSAICTENGGTLFVGEKNAGKSSLCLGGVIGHNAKLISDDITLLFMGDDKVYAEGIFKGINANENTISVLKTGLALSEQTDIIKDRYIAKDGLICGESRIDRICFSRIPKASKNVTVSKIKRNTFDIQVQKNIIRSFFGKRYHMNPYLVTDIVTTLYNSASVYNVELNSNLMVSFDKLDERINIT